MKTIIKNYTFDKTAKTVTLTNYSTIDLASVMAVINETLGVILYSAASPSLIATVLTNVLTLNASVNTTSMNNADKLTIIYWETDIRDNDPLPTDVIRPQLIGGKAVDVTTYTPGYTSNDSVVIAFNKDTGALLVQQSDLTYTTDSVASRGYASSTNVGTYSKFTISNAGNTGQIVKASSGNLRRITILNIAGVVQYVKIYDKPTAPTSSDTPIRVYSMTSTIVGDQKIIDFMLDPLPYTTGLSVRVTTGITDGDTTSPGTLPRLDFDYI